MLPSINTMHLCSQEQAHIYIQFNLKKASLAVWQRKATELQKAAAGTQAKQPLFPEEWKFEGGGLVPITHKRRRGVWYCGVFSKVLHLLRTIILFDFKKFLHCASWPATHEKFCHACLELVLDAGRAGKWQFLMVQQAWTPFAQARTPGEMETRKSRARSHYKLATRKSPREPGHDWCHGGARAAGKNQASMAQGSPDRGCTQCTGWSFSDLEYLDLCPKHSQAKTILPNYKNSPLLLSLSHQLVQLEPSCAAPLLNTPMSCGLWGIQNALQPWGKTFTAHWWL